MIFFVLCLVVLAACSDAGGTNGPETTDQARGEVVLEGLEAPVHLTAPPSDPRLFVVEQAGRIRVAVNGRLRGQAFLDITDRVRSGGERGLLSVAFHPDYASNGLFFVNYTDTAGATTVERYSVSADPDRADPASGRLILRVPQPFSNHNGGLLVFGPDGMLYVGMGDGGSGGDPHGHGQDTGTLLGALLRIDVDGGDPYRVPADNPFVGQSGRRPEIWMYGLRNPWRFAFDPQEGLLYIADVGQNSWEEVNVVVAGAAGLNLGWNVMEGSRCFRDQDCDASGLVAPVLEYGHDDGCSVTGGLVYRGSALAGLDGHYFYGDFCDRWVRSFRHDGGRATAQREWRLGDLGPILSFGTDATGELYILSGNGRVYRLAPGG